MAIAIIVYCKDHPNYKALKPPKKCDGCWSVYNAKWSANFRNEFGDGSILSGNSDLNISSVEHDFKD